MRSTPAKSQQISQRGNQTIVYIVLIIASLVSIYPFVWTFINATHHTSAVLQFPPFMHLGDQARINLHNLNEKIAIGRVLLNSVVIATVQTSVTLFIVSMAGYAFAHYQFHAKKYVFGLLLLSMMVPYQATLVSLFKIFSALEWRDTYQALILPGLCNIFALFLMTQNMKSYPYELIEAARMDGSSDYGIFMRHVLPNMKPAMAATSIFVFMSSWNNFMWPLIMTSTPEMRTLPVALSSLLGFSIIDYGQVMMGITISTIPIIIFFLSMQRYFIAGVTGSGLKG